MISSSRRLVLLALIALSSCVGAPDHPVDAPMAQALTVVTGNSPICSAPLLASPHLSYGNGPLIGQVNVSNIYWGSSPNAGKYDSLTRDYVTGPLANLSEYSAGGVSIQAGTFAGSQLVSPDPPSLVYDNASLGTPDVQDMLVTLVDSGLLPKNDDGNQLYVVVLPPNVNITAKFGTSCGSFAGYHGSFNVGNGPIRYAVIAPCGNTTTISHEIAEAVTDPDVTLGPLGWTDQGLEIGDLCNTGGSYMLNGNPTQCLWSNLRQGCVDDCPLEGSCGNGYCPYPDGLIDVAWRARGGCTSPLGQPISGGGFLNAGLGSFTPFEHGSLYFSPPTGTHSIQGSIQAHWNSLGAEAGTLGYPTTDEKGTADGIGRYNHFFKTGEGQDFAPPGSSISANGSIYYTQTYGAWSIHGAIRKKWASLGWEGGSLGYPVTDEKTAPDGVGHYNHFLKISSGNQFVAPGSTEPSNGSIYDKPGIGAFSVHGAIRQKWASLGWEGGSLGYPTSDEFSVSVGRQNNFEHGYIVWNSTTNVTTAYVNGQNPCSGAGDGFYCGSSTEGGFAGGQNPDELFDCVSGGVASTTSCTDGCVIAPAGTADYCRPTDPCTNAADGLYCWNSTQGGFTGEGLENTLYDCSGGKTSSITGCTGTKGCVIADPGTADYCDGSTCTNEISCGGKCCSSSDQFCGLNGTCCDGVTCSSNCPC